MMKKRRHHFVWQYYLKPWLVNGQLWCVNDGKAFPTNTKNIGQERDFYKLEEMSQNDIEVIKKLFIDGHHPQLIELNMGWLNSIQSIFSLKKIIEEAGLMGEEASNMFEIQIVNLEENLYEIYEHDGEPILTSLQNSDTTFYNTEDGAVAFVHFICSQYFRTKSMQESLLKATSYQSFFKTESAMNVLRHIITTTVAWNINNKISQWRPILITTNGRKFITADQPVINTFAPKNREAEADGLELYYPISPNIAVLFTDDDEKKAQGDFACNDSQVGDYNRKIIEQSHQQVYADSRETLVENGLLKE